MTDSVTNKIILSADSTCDLDQELKERIAGEGETDLDFPQDQASLKAEALEEVEGVVVGCSVTHGVSPW